jgi:hypothetical protein
MRSTLARWFDIERTRTGFRLKWDRDLHLGHEGPCAAYRACLVLNPQLDIAGGRVGALRLGAPADEIERAIPHVPPEREANALRWSNRGITVHLDDERHAQLIVTVHLDDERHAQLIVLERPSRPNFAGLDYLQMLAQTVLEWLRRTETAAGPNGWVLAKFGLGVRFPDDLGPPARPRAVCLFRSGSAETAARMLLE